MKKILLLLIIISLNIYSKDFSYKAVLFSINNNGVYNEWKECNIICNILENENCIIIQSISPQLFFIQDVEIEYFIYFDKMIFSVIDQDKKKCKINFYLYKSGYSYMEVEYSNIKYVYDIRD